MRLRVTGSRKAKEDKDDLIKNRLRLQKPGLRFQMAKSNQNKEETTMERKQMNMSHVRGKFRFWMAAILTIVALLAIAVPALGAGPGETNREASVEVPPPVSVPVILDGVLYQADEFNRLQNELYPKDAYLIAWISPEDGSMLAFTSAEGYDEYAKEHDLPTTREIEEASENVGPSPIIRVAVVPMAVPAIAAEAAELTNPDRPPPVSVPVILDGVLYQADEFNRLQNELYPKPAYVIATADPKDGTMLAFTSTEAMDKLLEEQGLQTTKEIREAAEKGEPASIEILKPREAGARSDYVVSNWENISYGGSGFTVAPSGTINNLGSIGWDNRISSVEAAYDYAEILYENINLGGQSFLIRPNEDWWNLHNYGWGDRASSLQTGG